MDKTSENIIKRVLEMDENEAKATLSEIFINYRSIGVGGYSKEKCFEDNHNIYKAKVVGPLIHDEKYRI